MDLIDIDRFISERSAVWDELDTLLARAEAARREVLPYRDSQHLLTLYRRTCSDLNQARSYTANADLLDRLNGLTGRGYRLIYRGGGGKTARNAFASLLRTEIPQTFRRHWIYIVAAAIPMLLGVLFGIGAVLADPGNGRRLVPAQFFASSPKERVTKIEQGKERIDSVDKALVFGASLYTHNIEVSFLAFGLGAITLVGGWLLLFYNGVILGAVAAMYFLDGEALFFLAWVGPHGALELPAIVFGGAAGLMTGRAFLMPGSLSRTASVRNVLAPVWRIMAAAALTLVCAGLVEGSFSQFSAKTFAYPYKIAVAAILFLALTTYLFLRSVAETPAPGDSR